MARSIPFFYADLIARIIPGAVALALLYLTTLQIPTPEQIAKPLGDSKLVILPLLYAGLAYVVGTILEAGLSGLLEKLYNKRFKPVLRDYTWVFPVEQFKFPHTYELSVKGLSRSSFGQLSVAPSENERHAMSHIIRYHSEAKMCFNVSVLLLLFVLAAGIQNFCDLYCIEFCDLDPIKVNVVSDIWLWLLCPLITLIVLVPVTCQRLSGRARFIIRTVERLADGSDRILKALSPDYSPLN